MDEAKRKMNSSSAEDPSHFNDFVDSVFFFFHSVLLLVSAVLSFQRLWSSSLSRWFSAVTLDTPSTSPLPSVIKLERRKIVPHTLQNSVRVFFVAFFCRFFPRRSYCVVKKGTHARSGRVSKRRKAMTTTKGNEYNVCGFISMETAPMNLLTRLMTMIHDTFLKVIFFFFLLSRSYHVDVEWSRAARIQLSFGHRFACFWRKMLPWLD